MSSSFCQAPSDLEAIFQCFPLQYHPFLIMQTNNTASSPRTGGPSHAGDLRDLLVELGIVPELRHRVRRSRTPFSRYRGELRTLLQQPGATYESATHWLAGKGVRTSKASLRRWIVREEPQLASLHAARVSRYRQSL